MASPLNPAKAWLLLGTLILCGVAALGFVEFLITYDPAETATALRQRWVWGTVFTLAGVGLALVCRTFRRVSRGVG